MIQKKDGNFQLKKSEWLLLVIVLSTCLAILLVLRTGKKGLYASVFYYNREIEQIDLRNDGIYYVTGDIHVTLEVKDGRIRFIDSVCPDHICEGYGWIGGEIDNDIAICMPAGITVQVKSG